MKNNLARFFAVAGLFVLAPVLYGADFAKIPIEDRMRKAERMADGLRVDGQPEDWNVWDWGIYPMINEPAGDCADRSRDLVSTRVAANREGLYVCVGTSGLPSKDNFAFGFRIDFAGTTAPELEFSNSAGNTCPSVTRLAPGKPPARFPVRDIQLGVGKCVEWFVPWSALAQALPVEDREAILGGDTRSWLRITTSTWDHRRQVVTDHGSAAACVRLPRAAAEIDEPLPDEVTDTAEMSLMADGQVYFNVGAKKGPASNGNHRHGWCYDMTVVDTTMSPSRVRDSLDNTQYYAWGKELIAPFAGRLSGADDTADDHAPFCKDCQKARSNAAYLQAGGKTLWFVHNQKGTLVPKVGQQLNVGDPIAKIGNSGPTAWPHVHLQVHQGQSRANLIPIVLKDVRVKLNPTPNDYWARDLSKWHIDEGFFVEKTPTGNLKR